MKEKERLPEHTRIARASSSPTPAATPISLAACCIWRRSKYQVSCRKPFCGGAQDETRIATIFVEIAALSETLRQSGQECAARTELRGKDAEPGAAADLVDLVEQVEDVETKLHPL